MRILVATDASPPQVNGVVRSLQSLAANARKLGVEIEFLTPEGFRSFPLPTYPSIRCAIPTWREISRRMVGVEPGLLERIDIVIEQRRRVLERNAIGLAADDGIRPQRRPELGHIRLGRFAILFDQRVE